MSGLQKSLNHTLNRNLLFVHGKGGVGKTVLSQAIAQALSEKGAKTLWIALEDPTLPPGNLEQITHSLWHLNCSFESAFEEYITLKVGSLSRLFLKNRLINQMAHAAPGIHELVLLGKIWSERLKYSYVVVDLPSTGHGLALFQSTENFSQLFQSGPLHRDASSMIDTFRQPTQTGHLIVALPEEMPLRESIELNHYLSQIFPDNHPSFLVNRLFPSLSSNKTVSNPLQWTHPLAQSMEEYIQRRIELENYNLRIWREAKITFGQTDFFTHNIVNHLVHQLRDRNYL